MDVILLQDVEKLGQVDSIVNVKPGYGRNYLIPQKIAMVANKANMKDLEERQKHRSWKEQKLLAQITDTVNKLKNTILKIGAKVGTTEKIFGSVTTHHLAEEIKKQTGIEIDRRKITIVEGDVKTLGTYTAHLDLHKDHKVDLSFEVIAE
jgi:large subunit ribosomal protein L9